MSNIIDFVKYKEKKDFKIKTKARVKQLKANLQRKRDRAENLAKAYEEQPSTRVSKRITFLENRHNYDMYYISLMDQFMAECYPEYRWKFSDWLEKVDV
jgi:hypothetical protein